MRILRKLLNNLSLSRTVATFSSTCRSASFVERRLTRRILGTPTCSIRYFSSSSPPPKSPEAAVPFADDQVLNEDLFWDDLNSLQLDEKIEQYKHKSRAQLVGGKAERRVFVLQLRMQYKSKARQSTTAELQLAESIALVETLRDWRVIDHYIVGMKRSHSKELFGEGNQELLSKKISASGADCLFIVIDHLTVSQSQALRVSLLGNNPDIIIYDRYKLVLEIFKRNARTQIAKLQIALAEIPYIRHKYNNVELYKNVERKIKRELELKLKTRHLQSADRRNSTRRQLPMVSVFGYTNAGKTSFIKAITGDEKMRAENKLFATLDISYHGTALFNSTQHVLFADTIGFISDIPYNLVEAFKTSLQDAMNADMYVHLVDASHPDREAQEATVNEILADLAEPDKLANMLVVYNKCDKLSSTIVGKSQNDDSSDDEKLAKKYLISSKTGAGIEEVRGQIESSLMKLLGYIELSLIVPQGGAELAYLYKNAIVRELHEHGDDLNYTIAHVMMNKSSAMKFVHLFPHAKIVKK